MATSTAPELLTINDRDLHRNKSPCNANAMLLTEQPARQKAEHQSSSRGQVPSL
jgi:hypothetical protein